MNVNLAAAIFQPLIVCSGIKDVGGGECTFASFIELIKVVINDLTVLATLLVVVAFIIIGFNLMTSGGNSSALSDAKRRAGSVLTGFVWILVAWIVVYTITSALLNSDYILLK